MNKFAIIDIGSNSVRLMLVADGKVLYKEINTTRLGEGIAQTPILKDEAIERSAIAVAKYYAKAKAEGAVTVLAFATAAVRSARNGNVFVQRVKELCGLDVEVIAGETEAEIGILGALGMQDGAVIDVGGASTELVVKIKGQITYKKSVNVGVVRLKDVCGRTETALFETSKNSAGLFEKVENGVPVYAIGGTATTLAALILGLEKYDPNKITGFSIARETMLGWAKKLLKMRVEEIAKMPCVPNGRADVLTGGAVWLAVLMDELSIDKIIVSDRDNLEGYAIYKGLM